MRVPAAARRACAAAGLAFREGVHGAAHALLNVLPRFMMCNAGDVGGGAEACSGARRSARRGAQRPAGAGRRRGAVAAPGGAGACLAGVLPAPREKTQQVRPPPQVGTECDNPYDTRYRPERLLLFDKLPGGIGLAQQAGGPPACSAPAAAAPAAARCHARQGRRTPLTPGCPPVPRWRLQAAPLFALLLEAAAQLVAECDCSEEKGCPSCIQHLDCKNYNAVLNKQGGCAAPGQVLPGRGATGAAPSGATMPSSAACGQPGLHA